MNNEIPPFTLDGKLVDPQTIGTVGAEVTPEMVAEFQAISDDPWGAVRSASESAGVRAAWPNHPFKDGDLIRVLSAPPFTYHDE